MIYRMFVKLSVKEKQLKFHFYKIPAHKSCDHVKGSMEAIDLCTALQKQFWGHEGQQPSVESWGNISKESQFLDLLHSGFWLTQKW